MTYQAEVAREYLRNAFHEGALDVSGSFESVRGFVQIFAGEMDALNWSGWLAAIACGVCLVVAIGYNWSGYAGVFWGAAFIFGFLAVHLLAPLDRRSENVLVEPIIIFKLALSNVERQIFATNLTEGRLPVAVISTERLNGGGRSTAIQ